MSEIYSVSRVAEMVGKTPQSVRSWCRNQGIDRDGRTYLITQEVLEKICDHYQVEFGKLSESERENFPSSESKKETPQVESLLIQLMREQLETKDRQIAELEETNKALAKSIAELTETNKELASSTKALSASAAMTTAADKRELILSTMAQNSQEKEEGLIVVPTKEIIATEVVEPEEQTVEPVKELTRWQRLKLAWKGERWF